MTRCSDFFAAACEQDATAMALMGDSVGNRVSKAWLELMLRRARDTAKLEAFKSYMRSFIRDDFAADAHKVKAAMLVLYGEFEIGRASCRGRVGGSEGGGSGE